MGAGTDTPICQMNDLYVEETAEHFLACSSCNLVKFKIFESHDIERTLA